MHYFGSLYFYFDIYEDEEGPASKISKIVRKQKSERLRGCFGIIKVSFRFVVVLTKHHQNIDLD